MDQSIRQQLGVELPLISMPAPRPIERAQGCLLGGAVGDEEVEGREIAETLGRDLIEIASGEGEVSDYDRQRYPGW